MIIPVINQDKNIQSECTPIRSKRPLDPSQFSAVPRIEVSKVVGKQKLSNENEPRAEIEVLLFPLCDQEINSMSA